MDGCPNCSDRCNIVKLIQLCWLIALTWLSVTWVTFPRQYAYLFHSKNFKAAFTNLEETLVNTGNVENKFEQNYVLAQKLTRLKRAQLMSIVNSQTLKTFDCCWHGHMELQNQL